MCFCVFFADIHKFLAQNPAELKVLLATLKPQSNESDTVDNNGDNEALPKGSDTRDNESSDPQKVDNCSPLDKLVDVAVQKVEKGAESEAHIASNRSSNKVTKVEHSNKNPNESEAHIASKLCEKEDENPNKLREKEKFETVSKVKKDAVAATDIVSDTSSNNVSQAKNSSKNPNKLDETKDRLSDQSNTAGNESNQDNHGVHTNTKTNALAKAPASSKNTGSRPEINLFGTSSDSESAPEVDDISKAANETVSKVKNNAVTGTEIASDTSSNNVSQAKHSSKNPNKLDNTKDRLSDQSNTAGNDSNQDNHGVHTNTKTDALAENAGHTSGTDFGSSESELAAEEEENVPIPYQFADEKWDYIVRCDINNIKKHAENASIEVEIRIQTCFIRSGQYQSDFVQLHSEFVLVWHFLCYLFNFLCCPF